MTCYSLRFLLCKADGQVLRQFIFQRCFINISCDNIIGDNTNLFQKIKAARGGRGEDKRNLG